MRPSFLSMYRGVAIFKARPRAVVIGHYSNATLTNSRPITKHLVEQFVYTPNLTPVGDFICWFLCHITCVFLNFAVAITHIALQLSTFAPDHHHVLDTLEQNYHHVCIPAAPLSTVQTWPELAK